MLIAGVGVGDVGSSAIVVDVGSSGGKCLGLEDGSMFTRRNRNRS